MTEDQTAAPGVYFRVEDYLGVAKRLLIDLVDVPVAIVLSVLVVGAAWTLVPAAEDAPGVTTIAIRTYMFWGMTFLFREVRRGAA